MTKMAATFQTAPVKDATANLHVHPSSVMEQSISDQLLPEHQSSVPSLSDSPLPACDDILNDTTVTTVTSGRAAALAHLGPSLASTLQPSETLERELDEVANLLAQQPRLDGGPRRPMNAFLIFARWRRMQMAQTKGKPAEQGDTAAVTRSSKRKQANRKLGPKPAEVSAALGEEWKSLSQEQQAPFHRKATQLRADFDRKNPEYKFTRGSKGCAKKRRQEAMELKALARQAQRQTKAAKGSSSSRESIKGRNNNATQAASGLKSSGHDGSMQAEPLALDHLHHHGTVGDGQHGAVSGSHDSELTELPEDWSPRKMLAEGSPSGRSPLLFGHHRRVSEGNGLSGWRQAPGAVPPAANYTWQYGDGTEAAWSKGVHFMPDPSLMDRQYVPHHHAHPMGHQIPNYQLEYAAVPDAHISQEMHMDSLHAQGARQAWFGNPSHHSPMTAQMQLPQYSNMFATNAAGINPAGVPDGVMHWRQEGPYEYEYPQPGRHQLLPPFEGSPRQYQVPLPGPGAHAVPLFQPHGRPIPGKTMYTIHPSHNNAPASPGGTRVGGQRPEERGEGAGQLPYQSQQQRTLRHQQGQPIPHQRLKEELKANDYAIGTSTQLHTPFAPEGAVITEVEDGGHLESVNQPHQQAPDQPSEMNSTAEEGAVAAKTDASTLFHESHHRPHEGGALRLSLSDSHLINIDRHHQHGRGLSDDSPHHSQRSGDEGPPSAHSAGEALSLAQRRGSDGGESTPALTSPSFVGERRESRTSVTLDAAMRNLSKSPGLTGKQDGDGDGDGDGDDGMSLTPLSSPGTVVGVIKQDEEGDGDGDGDGDEGEDDEVAE